MASIFVDTAGRNAITVVAGANLAARDEEFRILAETLKPTSALMLQCERAPIDNLRAAEMARRLGACIVLDPAPVPADGSLPALASLVDFVTPNETETEMLTGIAPMEPAAVAAAADVLHRMGFRAVIIKLGARGAFASTGQLRRHFDAPQVACVDSVAAGDCFNAAFAVRLRNDADVGSAVHYACAAGALCVSRQGAASSAPTAAELAAYMPTIPG